MHIRLPRYPFPNDWLIVGATAVVAITVGYANGFELPHHEDTQQLIQYLVCLTLASTVRVQNLFPKLCTYLAMLVWVGFTAKTMAHANYVLTSLNLPLWDQHFAAADALIGINHVELREGIAQNEFVSKFLLHAYTKTYLQLYLGIALLVLSDRRERLADTLSVVALGAVATLVFSTLMPAAGTYPYFHMSSLTSGYLTGFDTGAYYDTYTALRSGAINTFPTGNWHGIVTFPSFHVIYSLTGLYAVAHIRPLAIISALFSVAVAVSAVPVGGHYLIDIVGGVAIWCAAVWYVERRRAILNAATTPAPEINDGAIPAATYA